MTNKGKVLVVVAARGGSKGIKNKNVRELCGVPLIAHTILQAKKWGKADRIVCSTDSAVIADVAKKYGADVPFIRPARLAKDTSGKIDVLRHCLKTVEKIYDEKYSFIIDLDATAPIRKITDIDGAFKLFVNKHPKSVFSVTPARKNPYFNMVEIRPDGYASLAKQICVAVKRRQDAPKVFDMNASIYIYDREYLLDKKTKTAISDCSLIWEMDEYSAFDIDHELDFKFIEYLVSKRLVSL